MTWSPDDPFPGSAAFGETETGARHLPAFLCSLLRPGPVLVLGSSEVALAAAGEHEVVVVDWNRRRLGALERSAQERGRALRAICRDPERQDLGLAPRSVANVVCLDVLERFRCDVAVLEKVHRVLGAEGRLVARVRARPGGGAAGAEAPGPNAPRTYDPDALREALEEAGFRTLNLRYWNLLGLPSAYWRSRRRASRPREPAGVPSWERARPWWQAAVDLWFRAVENRVGFPAGVSLVAVATPHVEKCRVRREVLERRLTGRAAREAYEPMATAR